MSDDYHKDGKEKCSDDAKEDGDGSEDLYGTFNDNNDTVSEGMI
jgi:hypothetical protein